MSKIALLSAAAFAVLCGCTHTNSDGAEVSTNPLTNTTTFKDSKGNTATMTQNGSDMTIKANDGTMTVSNGQTTIVDKNGNKSQIGGSVSESDLGVPFYPGSVEAPGGMSSNTDKGSVVQSIRTTSDDATKVMDFYTQKIGKPETTFNSNGSAMATWKDGKKATLVSVSTESGNQKIVVSVSTDK
jgi:hypothetical protein